MKYGKHRSPQKKNAHPGKRLAGHSARSQAAARARNRAAHIRRSPDDRRTEETVQGVFSGTGRGFGFLHRDDGADDLFIPAHCTAGALDGDRVSVRVRYQDTYDGRPEGQVLRILEQGRSTVIGTLCEGRWLNRRARRGGMGNFFVIPDDTRLPIKVRVTPTPESRTGDKVEVRLRRRTQSAPDGEIVRVFGPASSLHANYESILAETGVPVEFDPFARLDLVPSRDLSGHGTAVAGIAAGNGRGSEGRRYRGAAPEAELVVVKMGTPRQGGFPRTTELMQGVDYIVRTALRLGKPVAVNISFGNTYGSHDGTSLLERFLNDISETWKNVICVGTGNEGSSGGHTGGQVPDDEDKVVEIAVQPRETNLNVQIWKSYVDEMDISVISPSGVRVGPIQEILGSQRLFPGGTEILLYYGEPKPYSVKQEIYLSFLPEASYIESGVWQIVLTPRRIVDGTYEMWLPSQNVLNAGTAFLRPSPDTTLTIPSTASLAVTVAAYDALTFSYADFSGRGPASLYEGEGAKPDLAAPGVRITAPVPGGGYRENTGTSFAAPFVTGSAALLMEWGIVQGNDPYLYGEKVKAYLRRGAREVPGYDRWPNAQLGYGILCVKERLLGNI